MIKTLNVGNLDNYTLILSRPDHTHLGKLDFYEELHVKTNLNAPDEISFTYYLPPKEDMNSMSTEERTHVQALWDELVNFKYVYVRELNSYFEIEVDLNDAQETKREVSGKEAVELGNIRLNDLEINSEKDIAREDYKDPTVFYQPDKISCSLLHRVLEKAPNWSIGHVDTSLNNIQRTFSESGVSIYDFLTGIVAEEIGCLFDFKTAERVIDVYDMNAVCKSCGHRGDFENICPECNSTDLTTFGEETTVYVDVENLADNISYTEDLGSVKNTFKLEAGDEDMTAAIRNVNPNGTDYIYYFSQEMKHEMPPELVAKLDSYDVLYKSKQTQYQELTANIYDCIEQISKLTTTMMPTVENTPTTAKAELAKLTPAKMATVALPELTQYTVSTTATNAIQSWVRLLIDSGKYRVSTTDVTWTNNVQKGQANPTATWKGKIVLESWSTRNEKDEKKRDEVTSEFFTVSVTDQFQQYIEQKVQEHIKSKDDEKGSVYDVLNLKDLAVFKKSITYYCLTRLSSFQDALQGILNIMTEAGQGDKKAELYDKYTLYRNMLIAVQDQMALVEHNIATYKNQMESYEKNRNVIQTALNFPNYLGTELYKTFCIYRREDTYSNKNFISDDLENDELFKMASQFYKRASEELVKSAESQHKITGTLHNLLALEEFAPIVQHFKLGNFIRVGIDKKVYKLRLTSVGLSGSDATTIDVEFSDVVRTGIGYSDIQSILKNAQRMATSYDANMQQMRKASEKTKYINSWLEDGFSATTAQVVNDSTRQELTISDTGLTMRRKVDYTENDYEPYQTKMIGSGIYFTDDNWVSVKSALGKYVLNDPATGQKSIAFGVLADAIVGRLILGQQLGLYSEDGSSTMSFDDRGLILNARDNGSGVYKNIFEIQKDGVPQLYVDNQGNLTINTKQVGTINETVANIQKQFGQFDNLFVHNSTLENLFAGSAGIGNLSVIKLSAQNCVLADASIAKAIIGQLNAGQIDSAFINTDCVRVGDANGNIQMKGSTIQVVDDTGKVRVQIGKDATTGEFSYWLWNEQGKMIWNPQGITAEGVPNQLVTNAMVSDNAAISANKLDIRDVASSLNADGSLVMNATQITMNSQTLDYLIQQITTKQTDQAESIKDIGTQVTAVQGQITNKIWQEDINTTNAAIQGQISTINKKYSQVDQTIDGLTTRIANTELKQTETETTMTNKFAEYQNTLSGYSTTLNNVNTKVTENQTAMTTEFNNIKGTLSSHTQSIGSVQTSLTTVQQNLGAQSQTVETLNGKVVTMERDLSGISNTVANNHKNTTAYLGSLSDALEGKADGASLSALESRVSTISQTADNIALRVTNISETVKKTIASVNYYYLATGNKNTVPSINDAGWATQPPVIGRNQFLWQMTEMVYTDGTKERKSPVCMTEKGNDAIALRIDSTNGSTFKNSFLTDLNVTIIRGTDIFTTYTEIANTFGGQSKIVWQEKADGAETFTDLNQDDLRILNGGMTLRITDRDVLNKKVFNAFLEI